MDDTLMLYKVFSIDDTLIYRQSSMFFVTKEKISDDSLSLIDSFKLYGAYVFAHVNDGLETFVTNLTAYLNRSGKSLLFLWISNPNEFYGQWNCQHVFCTESSEVKKGKRVLGKNSQHVFGVYRFILNGSFTVTCKGDCFCFEYPENQDPPVVLKLKELECVLSGAEIKLEAGDNDSGSFKLLVEARPATEAFKEMDCCIKYSMSLPKNTIMPWKNGHVGILSSYILEWEKPLPLKVSISPHLLCDKRKTYFVLPQHIFLTNFLSPNGDKIFMKAKENASIVFESKPLFLYKDNKTNTNHAKCDYYLGISGDFELVEKGKRILCGLSGVEYADLSHTTEAVISFSPGQNSHINAEFADFCTTSRIQLPPNVTYYTQPDTSPFFMNDSEGSLRYFDMPAAIFLSQPDLIPIIAYHNCQHSFHDNDYLSLLEEHIYSKRREILTPDVMLHDGIDNIVATPNGLMAGIDKASGKLSWVGLANTLGTNVPNLQIKNISDALRNKFQQRKVFIFIQSKEEFIKNATTCESFFAKIDDWTFLLSANDWVSNKSASDTAMIIKLTDEKSIAELAKDSLILKSSIECAYDEKNNEIPEYKDFLKCIYDVNFTGVIFLNCKIDIKELPKELTVLMRDISSEKIKAHHIIFNSNKVSQKSDGSLFMEDSVVSAVVDYKTDDVKLHQNVPVDYDFYFLKMTAVFKNSRLTSFKCMGELMINNLFGAKSKCISGSKGDCLYITGTAQINDGSATYIFSLLEQGEYTLAEGAITEVCIDKVIYTVSENEKNVGVFKLQGRMYFTLEEVCDILSYGHDGELPNAKGLIFDNVQIFMPNNSNMYSAYNFISLNAADSIPRKDSFGQNFACSPSEFLTVMDKSPDAMGYSSMTTPIRQGEIGDAWTGIVWDVPFGILGGISNSMDVSMKILFAWSISGDETSFYIGSRIASSLGVDGINIQSLLKLGFESVELINNKKDGKSHYTICLKNFTVQFLGTSFPSVSSNLFIFSQDKKLGWYAAVSNEE